jgi:hypothetical protein
LLLASLTVNEGLEIGFGEHAARMLLAAADRHVAQRAGGDVLVNDLDRAMQPRGGLGASQKAGSRCRLA